MPEPDSSWIILAELVRARGNRGEIAVNDLTIGPDRFTELGSVTLLAPDNAVKGEFEIEEAWDHNGLTILKFKGIDSINDAEKLRGFRAAIRPSRRRPLEAGEFFFGDLVGCQVIDAKNQTVYGRVAAVQEQGASGLLELEDGLLIPFVNDICVGIKPEEGRIEVILPVGLIELFRGQT